MRAPDVVIGGEADPYLRRWWVIPRNRFFNIYLHHFMRSDDDRALHDHPWWNVSIPLSGGYWEVQPADVRSWPHNRETRCLWRRRFLPVFRRARTPHRITLPRDNDNPYCPGPELAVWTIFITGRNRRSWGFWCGWGWRHWREFTAGPHGETVGRGCGE